MTVDQEKGYVVFTEEMNAIIFTACRRIPLRFPPRGM